MLDISALRLNSGKNMYQQHMQVPLPEGNRTPLHTNGVVVQSYQNITGYPVNPDVRLKKLAFFDVLATLLKPSTLVPNNQSNRVQESTFYFHLTPQQATDIASNRDIRSGSKVEHTIQVQLRFCLLETTYEQEDYFPPNVVVKVNNKLCNLPVSLMKKFIYMKYYYLILIHFRIRYQLINLVLNQNDHHVL